jgi:hypothetical protein
MKGANAAGVFAIIIVIASGLQTSMYHAATKYSKK